MIQLFLFVNPNREFILLVYNRAKWMPPCGKSKKFSRNFFYFGGGWKKDPPPWKF